MNDGPPMMANRKPPRAGMGRRKGVPNKATGDVRKMFAAFVEGNASRVQILFDRVARKNPAKALEILTRFSEFVMPKLQRAEIDAHVTASVREVPAWQDMSPVEAAALYQEIIQGRTGTTYKHLPSVNPYVAPPREPQPAPVRPQRFAGATDAEFTQAPAAEPAATNVLHLEPQHEGEHRPIADAKCGFCRALWVRQQRAASVPPAAEALPEPATDVGVTNPEAAEDEALRHVHVHTAKADSVCPGCRAAWVRQ
jgi:hypothetical protein